MERQVAGRERDRVGGKGGEFNFLLSRLPASIHAPFRVVFSSHIFIYYFLPAMLLGYYALYRAPQRWRNCWLIVTGYLFYGWAEPRFVPLMFFTTSVDWLMSLVIAHNTWRVWRCWGAPVPLLPRGEARSRLQHSAITVSVVLNLAVLGFFKYFNFGVDSYNTLAQRGRRDAPAMGHRAARRAAARHQLLHLPGALLYDRCLSRRRGGDDELHRFLVLRLDGAAPRRRPDPQVLVPRGPDEEPHADARQIRARLDVFHARAREENPAREPVRQGRRHALRCRHRPHARCLVRRGRVRLPDLLRFQRLLGHGDRPRAHARLRLREELRLAVSRRVDHRFLAALAHLAFHVAARVPLHSARRQSPRRPADLREPHHHDAARRALARRLVDLRHLGRPARRRCWRWRKGPGWRDSTRASPSRRALRSPFSSC